MWTVLLGSWKPIALGLLVAAFALMGWRVSAWHEAYKACPALEARLEVEEQCQEGSKCNDRQKALAAEVARVTEDVVDGYEKELADLRNRPVPTRVIRVCRAAAGDVRDAQSAAGTAAAGAAGAVVLAADEFDTRPLRELAREADEVSARLRALQDWNRALGATGK